MFKCRSLLWTQPVCPSLWRAHGEVSVQLILSYIVLVCGVERSILRSQGLAVCADAGIPIYSP